MDILRDRDDWDALFTEAVGFEADATEVVGGVFATEVTLLEVREEDRLFSFRIFDEEYDDVATFEVEAATPEELFQAYGAYMVEEVLPEVFQEAAARLGISFPA